MRLLALGAHADDVELHCGGTLALAASQGHEVHLLDMTRSELSSNGDPESRAREAERAARALGAAGRHNAGLPDGGVESADPAQLRAVVEWIRRLAPDLVIGPPERCRHPDHEQTGRLLARAAFLAGVARFGAEGEPHRPRALLQYNERHPFTPDLLVPMDGFHAAKIAAIKCYASQFERGDKAAPTLINRPDFLAQIEARDRYFGGLAGCGFAEAFLTREPPCVADLAAILPGDETATPPGGKT